MSSRFVILLFNSIILTIVQPSAETKYEFDMTPIFRRLLVVAVVVVVVVAVIGDFDIESIIDENTLMNAQAHEHWNRFSLSSFKSAFKTIVIHTK